MMFGFYPHLHAQIPGWHILWLHRLLLALKPPTPLLRKLQEFFVCHRSWHIGHCTPKGLWPICNGVLKLGSHNDYRNLIRRVGPPYQRGIVGIVIEGNRMFGGNAIFLPIRFSPNPICHFKHSKYIVELSPPPASFPVATRTNLSLEELKYLTDVGLIVCSVFDHSLIPSDSLETPSSLELYIDVKSFPKAPNFFDPDLRPKFQNKR